MNIVIIPHDYSTEIRDLKNQIEDVSKALKALDEVDGRTCVAGNKLAGMSEVYNSLKVHGANLSLKLHKLVEKNN